jgi:hypothetical protein
MKNNIFKISILSLFLMGTACKDALDVQPKQSLGADVALSDFNSVNALAVSLYARVNAYAYYGQNMMISAEVLADNYTITANPGGRYVNQRVNAPGATIADIWGLYSAINEANLIVANVDRVSATQLQKDGLKGEAFFIRGLIYADMLRIYSYEPNYVVNAWTAGVVLRTTPTDDASKADPRPRALTTEVYTQIENDLKEAANILPASVSGGGVFRANKAAAFALLSRVYLYQEKWALAEQAATDAITNKPASVLLMTPANLLSSYTTLAVPHRESLFELDYRTDAFSTVDGINNSMFSLSQANTGGVFSVRPTNELLAAFELGDVRRTVFATATDGGAIVSYSLKYSNHKGNFYNNVPVIRLSEVYLIRAEARAKQGPTRALDAQADLSLIRTNRGLAAVPPFTIGQPLIDLIFQERRVELNLEGHRFFDFKRRGLDIPKPAGLTAVPYSDFRLLGVLPNSQILLNPLLKQNPGY